jgi:Flp pilus assembly protein TadG
MKKTQGGVALLEFALILPFLLLLSITAVEFGRALWQYNVLTKSVRDAARYLAMQTPETKIAEARNLAVYGNRAGTGNPLAIGLTTAHVQGRVGVIDPSWQTAGTAPVINTVTVTIRGYTFRSMFSSVFGIPFGTMTYSDISATMRSYL